MEGIRSREIQDQPVNGFGEWMDRMTGNCLRESLKPWQDGIRVLSALGNMFVTQEDLTKYQICNAGVGEASGDVYRDQDD